MIDSVILNILKENGFDLYESLSINHLKSAQLVYRNADTKIEFFVVAAIDQKTFLEIDENKMFSDINKSLKSSALYKAEMDKNTSFILCIVKDYKLKSFEALEKKELQTEENPYFFKKYVLSYDEKVAQKLFGEILKTYKEDTKITKYIENIVTDPEKFRNYKTNATNNDEYMLLSKIVMKIPIMPVKVPDNQSIKPLASMINDSIISDNLQRAQNLIAFMTSEKGKEPTNSNNIRQIIDYWLEEQGQ